MCEQNYVDFYNLNYGFVKYVKNNGDVVLTKFTI